MSKGIFSIIIRLLRAGRCWPLLVIACYAVLLLTGLNTYIVWTSTGTVLGVIVLCMTTTYNPAEKGSVRFFLLSALMLLLYLFIPAKTILYFSCVCGGLFVAETFYGRVNHLPLPVLLIMSPLCNYVMDVFSFPIRLLLTNWSGNIIGMTGQEIAIHGNMITFNGSEFSVDPACIGLQMMVTSLLCGMLIIGIYQKQLQKELRLRQVLPVLGCLLILNVISNLLRIILLIVMHIMPNSIMHDVIGIICLMIYVVLPAALLIRWMITKYGKPVQLHRKRYVLRSAVKMFLLNVLLPVLMITGWAVRKSAHVDGQVIQQLPAAPGFSIKALPGSIIRLQDDKMLVYIKHIPAAYFTEHHPMICWRGSGYNFYHVEERSVNGQPVYAALLQQDKAKLYTAWWYDNGLSVTNSQLQWRWDVLRGAHPYSLINVTAASEKDLDAAIREILGKRPFTAYL